MQPEREHRSAKQLWDLKAQDWHQQVGQDGDANRRFNSDPVLWRFIGSVQNLEVLDAGCGTGYLARKLAQKGAKVVAVDFSERMIKTARELTATLEIAVDYRVDSCASLLTLTDESIDLIVSNYVLMDVPQLELAVASFYRVLRPNGRAAIVITHPCFPQSDETILTNRVVSEDGSVSYTWKTSYFDETEFIDPPWRHFTTPFRVYHRPLSQYWKTFQTMGFQVIDFDEPVVPDPPPPEFHPRNLRDYRLRPDSVAFLLRKHWEIK
ncbi:MAG: class I SAM-dependent methyltransferase [Candidatus Heimdallarchaeota archaeon]